MDWNFVFFFNSILLGIGLSMDAFSISLANGLSEPNMKGSKMCAVAGVFGISQGLMPMIGWICVHTIAQYFVAFEKLIPWIALILLVFIGGKMLLEGIRNQDCEECRQGVSFTALIVQGIATSIDALSVGFTIAEYDWLMALVAAIIIAAITFVVCLGGVAIGKKAGTKLSNKAQILGGCVLIFMGLEIFITGIF